VHAVHLNLFTPNRFLERCAHSPVTAAWANTPREPTKMSGVRSAGRSGTAGRCVGHPEALHGTGAAAMCRISVKERHGVTVVSGACVAMALKSGWDAPRCWSQQSPDGRVHVMGVLQPYGDTLHPDACTAALGALRGVLEEHMPALSSSAPSVMHRAFAAAEGAVCALSCAQVNASCSAQASLPPLPGSEQGSVLGSTACVQKRTLPHGSPVQSAAPSGLHAVVAVVLDGRYCTVGQVGTCAALLCGADLPAHQLPRSTPGHHGVACAAAGATRSMPVGDAVPLLHAEKPTCPQKLPALVCGGTAASPTAPRGVKRLPRVHKAPAVSPLVARRSSKWLPAAPVAAVVPVVQHALAAVQPTVHAILTEDHSPCSAQEFIRLRAAAAHDVLPHQPAALPVHCCAGRPSLASPRVFRVHGSGGMPTLNSVQGTARDVRGTPCTVLLLPTAHAAGCGAVPATRALGDACGAQFGVSPLPHVVTVDLHAVAHGAAALHKGALALCLVTRSVQDVWQAEDLSAFVLRPLRLQSALQQCTARGTCTSLLRRSAAASVDLLHTHMKHGAAAVTYIVPHL